MKKLKWILVALVLIAIVVLTIPKDFTAFTNCDHEYLTNECNIKYCTKCNYVYQASSKHTWQEIDCYQKVCTVCNQTASSGHEFTQILCTNKRVCDRCGLVQYTARIIHGNKDNIKYDDCSYKYICTLCHEVTGEGFNHTWSTYDKHQNAYCLDCGTAAPEHLEHNLNYTFFCFFEYCKECNYVDFRLPASRYVGAFIGLLLTIAAFIYIFVNRKRITVQGGKYIRTATPEAYVREGEAERHPF